MIILKLLLYKKVIKMWTEYIWLRKVSNNRHFRTL